MDLDDCKRAYEAWVYNNAPGSCTSGPLCFETSHFECSTYYTGHSFNPGGTCPGNGIRGSCTYRNNNEEDCAADFSENNCNAIGGNFTLDGKCPGEDIIGSCTIDEMCYNDRTQYECPRAGGTFLEGQDCPGTNVFGSCTVDGICYEKDSDRNDISQYYCSRAGGSFAEGKCPGSDVNGYCLIGGTCYASSQDVCDSRNGTFNIDMCPGYGSCTISNSVCIEKASPSYCTENRGVFAINNACSATLFPYCYDYDSNYCYRIGSSYVSSNSECSETYTYLAILSYCQNVNATIRN
jgi:hypothetical protein